VINRAQAERLAQEQPNVTVEFMSGGHGLLFERPDELVRRVLDFLSAKRRQLDVSQQNSVAAPTAYCFVTWMLFALVVSVNPAVCLVNDPLSEPNVRAV
jgi:hypothetical protein